MTPIITPVTNPTEALCHNINRLMADLTSCPQPMTIERLKDLLATPGTHLYMVSVEEEGIEPVGMFTLAVTNLPSGHNVWLEDVVVDNRHQGLGLGKLIVTQAIQNAQALCPGGKLMLTSRPSRLAANHIYSAMLPKKETNVYCLRL